jgi:hypothetical protein
VLQISGFLKLEEYSEIREGLGTSNRRILHVPY